MKKKPGSLFYALSGLATLAFFLIMPGFNISQSIDPLEAGKEIYTKGTSPSKKDVFALMSGVKVPASVLPCVNCHGADGAGMPEGGVTPSKLNWETLSNDNGGQHKDRRTHPPYTDKFLKRAITMGLDPAGNELLKTMPRYQMSLEDIGYLTAYIKILGKEKEKGVGDTSIKTGVLLPSESTDPIKREAIKSVLEAFFAEVNLEGGIYNRSFDLQFSTSATNPQKDFESTSCFAITSCIGLEADKQLADWASKEEMPILGATADWPVTESLDNNYVFYLYPGILKQCNALLKFLRNQRDFGQLNIALIYDGLDNKKELVSSVEAYCLELHPKNFKKILSTTSVTDLQKLCTELKEEGINTVFYLGSPRLENNLLEIADQKDWNPDFLSPGTLSGIRPFQIPVTFDQRVFLAYPTWLDVMTNQGWEQYQTLKAKYNLTNNYQNTQITALGSAMIYIETIRNCGRTLSKAKLITQLEKVYDYKTGLIPSVTYGLNKRVGSQKVFITSVDLKQSTLKLESIIE